MQSYKDRMKELQMFNFGTRRLSMLGVGGEYNNVFQIPEKNSTQKPRSVLYHHRGQDPEQWFYITGM